MKIGLDVGYSAVKLIGGDKRVSFPSIVGTPDKSRFSLNGNEGIIIDVPGDGVWAVGDGAISQSRFVDRREDRQWIESDTYYRLILAALTELTTATQIELTVVSGLPVAFYGDKDTLRDRLLGVHRVQREGRHSQVFKIDEVRVIPQPFGSLLSVALDEKGQIVNPDFATGAVGVIDIGGKTTNLLSVNRLSEIGKETASVNVGGWNVVRAVRQYLDTKCPNLELQDHKVIDAIISRQVKYYGQPVDLSDVVDETLQPMAAQVIAEATKLWNGAAGLDAILVSGGGALLLGSYLAKHFPHVKTVENPVFANAQGYRKLAQRLG